MPLKGLLVDIHEIQTRKDTLFMDEPLKDVLRLLGCEGYSRSSRSRSTGGATRGLGGKGIQEHETFVHFRPALHLAPRTTEFQIHHHTEGVNVHIGNAIYTEFPLG
jgi:hypothetical protein